MHSLRRFTHSRSSNRNCSCTAVLSCLCLPLQPLRPAERGIGYRSHDTSHMFAKQRKSRRGSAEGDEDGLSGTSHTAALSSSSSSVAGIRRREGGMGVRPAQSPVQARNEAEMDFPETLPSGRPVQLNTKSQRLFFENRANAAEFARQQQIDREYVRKMKEAQHSKSIDRRFFAKAEDYRDVRETDPYADLFGESAGTHRLRTAAWQRQFEKENEGIELPYERTNVIAKLAPNWFVRYFVNLRDKGGTDNMHAIVLCFVIAMSLLWLVGFMFYTTPSRARPSSEIR